MKDHLMRKSAAKALYSKLEYKQMIERKEYLYERWREHRAEARACGYEHTSWDEYYAAYK